MSKIAFLFPGQGSQVVGMGQDLKETYESAAATFKQAKDVLGFDYSKICFEGPVEVLKRTDITQPTVFLVSMICYNILKEKGIEPSVTAGNSLGEYGALTASGAIKFEDAVKLVQSRGRYMHEAALEKAGTMAAIIGLEKDRVEEICERINEIVSPALFNSPGQVVVSGSTAGVNSAVEKCKGAGARKCVILPVSGAWHSKLMRPAENKLAAELEKIEIKNPKIPLIANVTGDFVSNADEIRTALVGQLTKPVLWTDTIEKMVEYGVDTFVEVGPGKVLKGLVKRIARESKILTTGDVDSIEDTIKQLS